MNTVKNSLHLRLISVFCVICVMLSFSFYTRAEGFSHGSFYTDENGITFRLDKASLRAALLFGAEIEEASIPECLNVDGASYTVTSVDRGAFAQNTKLRAIELPATVTYVGDTAFFGCVSLKSVTAYGLTAAGMDAFSGTPFIRSGEFVILGDVLLRYNGKDPLVKNIPEVSFVADAFAFNSYIKTVILPSSVTEVGNGAFALCENLKNVSIPFSAKRIGDRAFFGCASLDAVSVSAGVKEIGESAFEGTPFLAQLTNAGGDTVILGDGVLIKYTGKSENVTLPAGVRYISDAFAYTSVKTVTVPGSCRIGKAAFKNAKSLYRLSVKGSIREIGDYAFAGCSSLEIMAISHDMTGSIGFDAFRETPETFCVYFKNNPNAQDGKLSLLNKGIYAVSPSDLTK